MHTSVAALAIAAMTLALTPAVADPLSGTDEYPDVAFLARNDVPFDAQTAASMAAQLGAPMFITNPNVLAEATRDGIVDLNPDVIIVAGGVFAVSDEVASEAAEACDPDCTIDRRFGAGRDQTAADLATIRDDYGFDRPVLQGSNQILGDVNIGGTANLDDLTIQDTEMVAGLNADRVDGMHASDFLGAGETAIDSDQLDGLDSSAFANATHNHFIRSVALDGSSGTDDVDLGGSGWTVVLTNTSTLADPCGGGATRWNVLMRATGTFHNGHGSEWAVSPGLRIGSAGEPPASTRGGIDIPATSSSSFATELFTTSGPGNRTFQLVGNDSDPADPGALTVTSARLIIQTFGYTCVLVP